MGENNAHYHENANKNNSAHFLKVKTNDQGWQVVTKKDTRVYCWWECQLF